MPSAVVVGVSSLATFYDFGRSHADNIEAQTNYALLLDRLEFEIVSAVEDGDTGRLDRSRIAAYRQALSDAVTERKDAFLDIVSDRSERNEGVGGPD